jgi:hypothetical protein
MKLKGMAKRIFFETMESEIVYFAGKKLKKKN